MGGDISVASEPGKGSTFTVTLPAEVSDAPRPMEARFLKERAEGVAGASGPIVLVIDDDPTVRELMLRSLGKDGYRVEVAADGHRRLSGDVARILGKDSTSRDQLVAEVRQVLTQQMVFHI